MEVTTIGYIISVFGILLGIIALLIFPANSAIGVAVVFLSVVIGSLFIIFKR